MANLVWFDCRSLRRMAIIFISKKFARACIYEKKVVTLHDFPESARLESKMGQGQRALSRKANAKMKWNKNYKMILYNNNRQ